MMSLTTIQRDLLNQLLPASEPWSAAALGEQLHLSARQVHYGLREVRRWLDRHQVTLRHTPGVGVEIVASREQRQRLLAEIAAESRFQLILSAEQRQQLLTLHLLASTTPTILSEFQQGLAVARATVLKDLDACEPWLQPFQVRIARRQHRGFWIEGDELARRQALAAFVWGDIPVNRPIMAVRQGGLHFSLAGDTSLLPLIAQINRQVAAWDLPAMQPSVVLAEDELGGRFTDEAVTLLTLALAIQTQRIAAGQYASLNEAAQRWITAQAVWPTALWIARQLWPQLGQSEHYAEAAALAIQLMAQPRDEPWRANPAAPSTFQGLSDQLMLAIAQAYSLPRLAYDQLLRDGLENHILPACVRQQFGLWAPQGLPTDIEDQRYTSERALATQLANEIMAATRVALPGDAYANLVLLLRAAVLRTRPERERRVLVVCPSGMATTQLLVARLRARFPHLGALEVLPTRALNAQRLAHADLIITTVALTLPAELTIDVIQVHPMLRAEDIAAITQWLV